MGNVKSRIVWAVWLPLLVLGSASGQDSGAIEGTVTLAESGDPLHGATVVVIELGRSTLTDGEGRFRFANVPPGVYQLMAHVDSVLTEQVRRVSVGRGEVATIDFSLRLAVQRQQVTVTASGKEMPAFDSFQSVQIQDSFDLAESIAASIGETLAGNPGNGVAKRSFGPGTERPIIRGFDGDRVLILQDGVRTGTLSSQSGDHGELINSATLDRMEVVKGPATLLYGSSALGGVVNAITRHHAVHEHPHEGLRGFLSATSGSANSFAGGSAGFEYGRKKWLIWGGGSGQDSGEYDAPTGPVPNSDTSLRTGYAGFGRYGERMFFSAGANYEDGLYGVPFAQQFHSEEDHSGQGGHEEEEEVTRVAIDARRQAYQFNWGVKNLARLVQAFTLRTNYTRWQHAEQETFAVGGSATGTSFDNKQFIYRGTFEQAARGALTGRFGFWGMVRDYAAFGEEALAPPVDHTALAVFGLEELGFEKVRFQFGGRIEHNRYKPGLRPGETARRHRERGFTGASAAAGVSVRPWKTAAIVANYAHTYRAPALEELYNNGPHVGNLAWEIGEESLKAETGDGIELSFRQKSDRVTGELNVFYYDFDRFVFPFLTGQERAGLRVVQYTQQASRFAGAESTLNLLLRRNLWLNLGADYVDAQEKVSGTPLPRIPPLRGRAEFDLHYRGLTLKPVLVVANQQQQTFPGETRTPGYATFDLKASYSWAGRHLIHQFAVHLFNINNRLYFNHSSFVKELAPEIGRGVRFTYRLRFF